MTSHAAVLTAGPKVVARALGYDVTKEDLGGPAVHQLSGVVDNIVPNETDAFEAIRSFLSFLPQNVNDPLPATLPGVCTDSRDRMDPELAELVPRNRRQPFDMREAIRLVVDIDAGGSSSFFEIGTTLFGRTQITGLARLDGHPVAMFANDGTQLAGAMTWDSSQKVKNTCPLVVPPSCTQEPRSPLIVCVCSSHLAWSLECASWYKCTQLSGCCREHMCDWAVILRR